MTLRISSVTLLILTLCLFSCDDNKEASLNFGITGSFGNEAFNIDQIYQNHRDQFVKFESLKFYISDLEIVNSQNESFEIKDVILFDYMNPENISINIPAGTYKTINFGLGIDSIRNQSDPVTFDPEHPLSYAQNTHWGWASKYRFILIDGRIDPVSNEFSQENSKTFSYHTGFDDLYRQISIDNTINLEENEDFKLNLNLDIAKMFNNQVDIDMFENNQSHALTEVARNITDNCSDAFTILNN